MLIPHDMLRTHSQLTVDDVEAEMLCMAHCCMAQQKRDNGASLFTTPHRVHAETFQQLSRVGLLWRSSQAFSSLCGIAGASQAHRAQPLTGAGVLIAGRCTSTSACPRASCMSMTCRPSSTLTFWTCPPSGTRSSMTLTRSVFFALEILADLSQQTCRCRYRQQKTES